MVETINKSDTPDFFMARFALEMRRFLSVYSIFYKVMADIESRDFKYLKHFVVKSSQPAFAASGCFVPYLDAKCRPLKRVKRGVLFRFFHRNHAEFQFFHGLEQTPSAATD